ncbi:MAG: hypothetical protein JNM25_08240 [Planctomycetes bacterium]|nr:hypothetical protein [Planctomycetota bacterium]
MRIPLAAVCTLLVSLPAQGDAPVAPPVPALPAADSPAAARLVDTALAKLQAFGRGTFRTTESHDLAMMRGAGFPIGGEQVVVEGGWQQGLVWGETDHDRFLRHGGRMVTKVGDAWKLRAKKLGSGRAVPFTLDPSLLCTVLQGLPAAARRVENVTADKVGERRVAVLSLKLEHELAREFVDSGVLPEVGGSFGAVFVVGGGFGDMQLPDTECSVHLALAVDPDNGDLLQVAVKVYEQTGGFGAFQVQVQGAGAAEDAEADEDEQAGEAKPAWKDGLPTRKPGKQESVLLYTVQFARHGLAEAPELDDATKFLLRLR